MASEFKRVNPSPALSRQVYLRDGFVCQYCATREAHRYILEHVVPVALGGPTTAYNLVTACEECNYAKRDRVWVPLNLDAITVDQPAWRERVLREGGRLNLTLTWYGNRDPDMDYPRRIRRLAARFQCEPWYIASIALCGFLDKCEAEDADTLDTVVRLLKEWETEDTPSEPDYEDALQAYAA